MGTDIRRSVSTLSVPLIGLIMFASLFFTSSNASTMTMHLLPRAISARSTDATAQVYVKASPGTITSLGSCDQLQGSSSPLTFSPASLLGPGTITIGLNGFRGLAILVMNATFPANNDQVESTLKLFVETDDSGTEISTIASCTNSNIQIDQTNAPHVPSADVYILHNSCPGAYIFTSERVCVTDPSIVALDGAALVALNSAQTNQIGPMTATWSSTTPGSETILIDAVSGGGEMACLTIDTGVNFTSISGSFRFYSIGDPEDTDPVSMTTAYDASGVRAQGLVFFGTESVVIKDSATTNAVCGANTVHGTCFDTVYTIPTEKQSVPTSRYLKFCSSQSGNAQEDVGFDSFTLTLTRSQP